MVLLMLSNCYQSSLFQGKKLSFYSGDLPQLYTLLLTSITSCQVSKRKESKREMSEEKRAQCKKGKLKRGDNAIRVANHQNNYNSYDQNQVNKNQKMWEDHVKSYTTDKVLASGHKEPYSAKQPCQVAHSCEVTQHKQPDQ